jgi:hypothetical protein
LTLLQTDVTDVIDGQFSDLKNGLHDEEGDRKIKRGTFLKAAASQPAPPQKALDLIVAGLGECALALLYTSSQHDRRPRQLSRTFGQRRARRRRAEF